jgi:hypothetical protein
MQHQAETLKHDGDHLLYPRRRHLQFRKLGLIKNSSVSPIHRNALALVQPELHVGKRWDPNPILTCGVCELCVFRFKFSLRMD